MGGLAAIWLAVAAFLGGGAIVAVRTPFDALVELAEPESVAPPAVLPDPD